MNVNQEVRLNLSADGIPPRLFMPQGDANSRTIVATLWDGATPYSVPANAAVMVRFRKPDGTGGLYDATEAGTAVTASGNTVTAPVATQMLAVAGVVQAEIDIYGTGAGKAADRLATFRFAVEVAPSVYPDAQIISSDYFNLIAATIAEAVEAAAKAEQAQAAAESAKTAAESAKAGAQAAQQGAETAKDAAQAAQSAAENAKAGAQAAQSGAESAKQGAQSAQAAAESAKTAAENAKAGAQSAQQGAQTAQQGAEAAQDAAEDAQAAAAASAAAAAASAANAATSVEGAVKYNTPQSLTPAQQAQARENINAPAPYEAGDNISISGRVITTKAFPCNPNLLDNWYFGNPVNQRGQTSYTVAGFTVDRWNFSTATGHVVISNGYLEIFSPGQYGAYLGQKLETALTKSLAGQVVTASVLAAAGDEAISFNLSKDDVYVDSFTIYPNTVSKKTFTVPTDATNITWTFAGNAEGYVRPIAVKLELGSEQTLAHQENGVWVLNEIPKFGDQLAECQRYAFSPLFEAYATAIICNLFVSSAANGVAWGEVTLPVSMRYKPVFSGNASKFWIVAENGGGASHPTAITVIGLSADKVMIKVEGSYTANTQYILYVEDPFTSADFLLSADL